MGNLPANCRDRRPQDRQSTEQMGKGNNVKTAVSKWPQRQLLT